MRRGFTLIELLVVICIISILAAILMPVFSKARAKARGAVCQSQLKQLALSIRMYVDDTGGPGPFNQCGSWAFSKLSYGYGPQYGPVKYSPLYSCPEGGNYSLLWARGAHCPSGPPVSSPWLMDQGVPHPENVLLIADARSGVPGDALGFYDCNDNGTARHLAVNNVAYCDGHVKGESPGWLRYEYENADAATGTGNWWYYGMQ